MFKRLFLVCVVLAITSCSKQATDEDTEKFAKKFFSIINCPKVQPMLGSFPVCATSYEISDVITINMEWSSEREMLLPLEKWFDEGKSELYMKQVVCDAIATGFGITEDAIFGNRAGIIQITDADSSYWSENKRENVRGNFAIRTRLVLSLSDEKRNYVVTRWAYNEANKVPELCSVVISEK